MLLLHVFMSIQACSSACVVLINHIVSTFDLHAMQLSTHHLSYSMLHLPACPACLAMPMLMMHLLVRNGRIASEESCKAAAEECAACVQLDPDLMPDALHPNAAGMDLLAQCILPFVKLYGNRGSS